MELNEKYIDGFWSENDNGGPCFFIINEAIISKLCILGEDVEPCFEGAQITKVQFSLEEDFKQKLFNLMKHVKEIAEDKEGGTNSVEDNSVKEPEVTEETPEVNDTPEEPQENENEQVEDEASTPENENEDEGEPVKYNLDEIQEYIELKADYDNLQTKFNEMKAEYDTLVEFKKAADRKEKEAMINSFYMLSDEDKKDVVENIDKYSLDDIEAKLSIICVRSKVNFNLNEEKEDEETNIVVLDSPIEDDVTPAWIKSARAMKKEME